MDCRCQVHHGWALIALTTGLLLLTCLQARASTLTRNLPLVNQSRSYSILVLRALSELAGVSLAATVATTLERIKWMLIWQSGEGGKTQFIEFLALQEQTTILGLFSLAAGLAVPSLRARLWSVVRLATMVFIPIVGILIMSEFRSLSARSRRAKRAGLTRPPGQVDIELAFSPVSMDPAYVGYGTAPLNASMAGEYTGLTDMMMSWDFQNFLGDSTHSIDLSPDDIQSKPCGLNANPEDNSGCLRTYFMPSASTLIMPELVASADYPEADVLLALEHRGYYLEFDAGDSSSALTRLPAAARTRPGSTRSRSAPSACACGIPVPTNSKPVSILPLGARGEMIWASQGNELLTRCDPIGVIACPGSIAINQSCMTDTSWYGNQDWTVKLRTSFRNATLAYSRSNATILWHAFTGAAVEPVNISAADILRVYDTLFFDTTTWNHTGGGALPPFSSSSFPRCSG